MTFHDHFSAHADGYAAHRPTCPRALLDWLASLAPRTGLAWEAGCGSGQLNGRDDLAPGKPPGLDLAVALLWLRDGEAHFEVDRVLVDRMVARVGGTGRPGADVLHVLPDPLGALADARGDGVDRHGAADAQGGSGLHGLELDLVVHGVLRGS